MMKKEYFDLESKNSKKKQNNEGTKGIATLNLWQQYNEFVRSLHLRKKPKKTLFQQKIYEYFKKILIVFIGSFFTTFASYFLIEANGLYKSGTDALSQIISLLIIGKSDGGISWLSYHFIYYGTIFLVNALIVFFLYRFLNAKLGIVSTSLFYVFSQFIWTKLFNITNARQYFLSNFNPSGWKGISSNAQFSLTLPYYICIAAAAAVIQAFGYSLIVRVQATTGGLNMIFSHLPNYNKKQKKCNNLLSSINKNNISYLCTFIIILLIIVANFYWNNIDSRMNESFLQRELLNSKVSYTKEQWMQALKRANRLEKDLLLAGDNELIKKSKEAHDLRWAHRAMTKLLESKIGLSVQEIEKHPQELEYYLATNCEKKIELIGREIEGVSKQLNENESKKEEMEMPKFVQSNLELNRSKKNDSSEQTTKLQNKKKLKILCDRLYNLSERKQQLESEQKKNIIGRIILRLSNDERFLATIAYIIISTYLINQIFPRNQIIRINIYCNSQENRNEGLKILSKFSPIHYIAYQYVEQQNNNDDNKENDFKEKNIYVIECLLSKWDYYLHLPYLEKIGKIYENSEK